ncbi:MAG: helix-hairpin-helix domain-containing protein [Phycisphaerae bacterium]|nr:helix-hairpin-helix domain-containing protein [Phycisphaerae bacterium]
MPDAPNLSGASKHAAVVVLLACVIAGFGAATLVPRVPRSAPAQEHGALTATINLNTATEAELEALPRIGPALARRIVEDRQANGPFRSVDDVNRVKGVGPRTIDLIRPYARAEAP